MFWLGIGLCNLNDKTRVERLYIVGIMIRELFV